MGINYILLEARSAAAPGAQSESRLVGVGFWINLACGRRFSRRVRGWGGMWFGWMGRKWLRDPSSLIEARFGYPFLFLERGVLFEGVVRGIGWQGESLLNWRVQRVEHNENGVVLICGDGSECNEDVVGRISCIVLWGKKWGDTTIYRDERIVFVDKNSDSVQFSSLIQTGTDNKRPMSRKNMFVSPKSPPLFRYSKIFHQAYNKGYSFISHVRFLLFCKSGFAALFRSRFRQPQIFTSA